MAQDEIIAKRYARGLAEEAAAAGDMETVRHDLRAVALILDPKAGDSYVPELASFLASPLAAADEKQKAFSDMMAKVGVGKTVANFICILIERGRVRLLPKIAAEFGQAAGDITGDRTAIVQTARRLTQDQEDRLAAVLSSVYGGDVHIRQQVEPSLLAGAKVVLGDRTFDGTVLGKLEEMRRRLTTGGVFDKALDAADSEAKNEAK